MKSLWILLALGLLGCGSGTDVGNPTDEQQPSALQQPASRDDFVAIYLDATATSSVVGSSPAACRIDADATHYITAGTASNEVTLSGIFDYSDLGSSIAGTVTNGTLAIDAAGSSTTLVCTGTLESTTLTITCDVASGGVTSDCQLVLEQQ